MANVNATVTINAAMQAQGDNHPFGQTGIVFSNVVRTNGDWLEAFISGDDW
jgi:hypothetical protein